MSETCLGHSLLQDVPLNQIRWRLESSCLEEQLESTLRWCSLTGCRQQTKLLMALSWLESPEANANPHRQVDALVVPAGLCKVAGLEVVVEAETSVALREGAFCWHHRGHLRNRTGLLEAELDILRMVALAVMASVPMADRVLRKVAGPVGTACAPVHLGLRYANAGMQHVLARKLALVMKQE